MAQTLTLHRTRVRPQGRESAWRLKLRREFGRARWGMLFIAPFFALFMIFYLYPVAYSLYLSFTRWSGLGAIQFVGLDNYALLLQDDLFWKSMTNSAILFAMHVPVMLLLAFGLAVALNNPRVRGLHFFRALIFLPYISNLVGAGITFRYIFSDKGALNFLLRALQIAPIPWLETEWGARIALCLLIIWAWVGYHMVIMLSGLQSIPRDVQEMAMIDGANSVQVALHVTLPLMRPVLVFTAVVATLNAFGLFTEVAILTFGGPVNATLTPLYYLTRYPFASFRLGYGAAVSYAYLMLVVLFTLIQVRLFPRDVP